ncbi:MAG: ACP S-malonyltransferase [Kofleriaceae bacterium]
MTLVLMFPGQSSRYPEMLARVAHVAPAVVEQANDLLGRDIVATLDLQTHRDVQLGVFLANHLHLQRVGQTGLQTVHSLGLSLGEYNHLVHIGALAFADAVKLVEARGNLFDHARGGLMVSVFPLEARVIEAAIARLGVGDRVGIGLYNSPRQNVISGERAAVEAVVSVLEADDYFEAVPIEHRIPMHSPAFRDAAAQFGEILAATPFSMPRADYLPNTTGEVALDPSPITVRARLADHVWKPVRWRASVDAYATRIDFPYFLEVGPKAVLHSLFGKDWMPGRRGKTDATTSLVDLTRIAEELLREP